MITDNVRKLFINSKGIDYNTLDLKSVFLIDEYYDKLDVQKGYQALYHRYTNIMELPERASKELVFHEVGHFIDDMLHSNPNEYASYDRLKSISFDSNYINKAFRKSFSFFKRRSIKTMCLQDIVFILTEGKHKYKYYRNKDELKDSRKVRAELFANMFCIKLLGNKEHIKFLEDTIPELWMEFNSIIAR